jgi:hypothetical protein
MARIIFRLAPVAAALALGACAGDSMPNLFQTASVAPSAEQTAAATPPRASRIDPACVTLAGQIEGLRKDGSIERLEKVAAGKGDNVQVKRTSVAKQAELNKANAEFQTKCGPRIPQQAMAPAVPAPVVAAAAPAAAAAAPIVKAAAAKAVAPIASGVTAVPSATPVVPAVPKAP